MSLLQRVCGAFTRQLINLNSRLPQIPQSVSISNQLHTQCSSLFSNKTGLLQTLQNWTMFARDKNSLARLHKKGPSKKEKKIKTPVLQGCPQKRAVVLRVIIKKPRKPNSANRKCVVVRLSNGNEGTAYVPGEGHNLQEHSVILVRGGRLKDVPGVRMKCVRGVFDLAHVKKKTA